MSTFQARASEYRFESKWVEDLELIDPLLADPPSASATLLDVCGGTGRLAERATQLGWRAAVSDLVGDMLRARGNRSIPAVQADAETLPFSDACADRIVVRQGLHYLEMKKALKEFSRVARSVALGHIVGNYHEDIPIWRKYFEIASPGRRVIFIRGFIEELLVDSGFRIESVAIRQSMARIGDSIRHLDDPSRRAALKVFNDAPGDFKERHEIAGEVTEETAYPLTWEFIIAR